ncbi:MAG: FkbM family methyltransferase [Mucilaginibacter polytrichastri]|nr:FkbM family methyltransferase [Mucilaginibacter polytrichastri]
MKTALAKLKIRVALKRLFGRRVALSDIALSLLRPDDTLFEAGAHTGWDTLNLAGLTQGTVHAFEPVPTLFRELEMRCRNAANVSCYCLALGTENGTVDMYLSSGSSDASSSLLKPKKHFQTNPDVFFEEKTSVPVMKLDSWAEQEDVKKVDFMWLDLQGMELAMLKHGRSVLKGVRLIYTEVSELELYENQASYAELRTWLQGEGFRLYKEELLWGHTGNVLFVRDKNA